MRKDAKGEGRWCNECGRRKVDEPWIDLTDPRCLCDERRERRESVRGGEVLETPSGTWLVE